MVARKRVAQAVPRVAAMDDETRRFKPTVHRNRASERTAIPNSGRSLQVDSLQSGARRYSSSHGSAKVIRADGDHLALLRAARRRW